MENRGEQINWEYSIKEKKTNYLFKNIFFNTDKYTLNGDIVVEDRYVAQFTMRFSPESEWKNPLMILKMICIILTEINI